MPPDFYHAGCGQAGMKKWERRKKGLADQEYETMYEIREQELIVRLPREVDHHSSQGIREVTEYCAREGKIRKIVFDFARTEFMDSTGIGILLGRYKYMKALGGTVALANVNGRVQRILKIAGIFQIIPNLEREA